VDDLSIYRNPVAAQRDQGAPLEVQFTLSGYVRPSATQPANPPADAGAGESP
ncbi:MAG TPA: type II secretion system protein GspM, partial [Rhodanobacter sp.]|nr:type II secretion system protein GspM [Rhodanobacter sp.]